MRHTSKFGGNSDLKDCYCVDAKELKVIDGKVTGEPIDRLAEFENLEEQGLLLRLPCKAGDTVYNIKWWDDVSEIKKIDGKVYYRTYRKPKVSKSKFSLFDLDIFGKEVFLTREEAEKALEKMKNGTNEN